MDIINKAKSMDIYMMYKVEDDKEGAPLTWHARKLYCMT